MRGAFLIALAAALVAPGFAGAEPDPTQPGQPGSTTTINGAPPPGVATRLTNMTVMLDTVDADGNRLLVQQGVRKPGTRAPIHFHDYGGHTCVLSGTITDFVEGMPASTFPAGTCYYMAPDVAMTAVNLGSEDVRLIDTFVLPPSAVPITVIEPGWPDLSDPTG